jgi:16S rRNA (cytosine1402-N4)-methyltransferase
MTVPHQSVLVSEVLFAFAETPLRIFVDATLGAGGHAEAILKVHPEIDLFIGIDQDPEALEIAQKRLEPWKPCTRFVRGNFSSLPTILKDLNITRVDGILMDLGVSSMQLDKPEKGFSFMRDGPLDMRMDPDLELTAADIVNTWSEEDLGRIFREYGEEKRWRMAAKVIVEARRKNEILTTGALAKVLQTVLWSRKKGINPLTLAFQGLRICVNRELEVLENTLPQAMEVLSKGGKLAVISFHSLEDRIVKNTFRQAASDKHQTTGIAGMFLDKEPTVRLITKKPLVADEAEEKRNPRSRSAKLRVVEKL